MYTDSDSNSQSSSSNTAGGITTTTTTYKRTRTRTDVHYLPSAMTLCPSPTNRRYFEDNDGNPVILVGSHTWGNGQDWQGYTFDWDTYLDNLVAWGHNFMRYWIWESPTPNGSPVLVATGPLSPLPWNRTGPGNAADGGLKFDLTSFNSTYFNRVRARCIDASNHGIYVSIMLFNGFSVAGKGTGETPFAYHPMQNGNNINGIDGDTDNDGEGYETQNDSIAAVTTAQKAHIAHLIDTVGDLPNILYEICNEPDGTVSGTPGWVATMIDYIHTYEDARGYHHPVWYTVEWPGGNNATLLASAAESIAPNADVTMDGTKIVIADTDHYFGIGGSADWAWKLFCNGAGGIAYMDSYDNLFIDGSGSGHPLQNLRDNLGYILDMAVLASLLSMIPQGGGGSPCQTGYCLYGGSQYICYQPSNGNFTLDLSGETGTFNIRKVRLSNGDIDTAQTTTGGASRTITQPAGWTTGWAAYLYK